MGSSGCKASWKSSKNNHICWVFEELNICRFGILDELTEWVCLVPLQQWLVEMVSSGCDDYQCILAPFQEEFSKRICVHDLLDGFFVFLTSSVCSILVRFQLVYIVSKFHIPCFGVGLTAIGIPSFNRRLRLSNPATLHFPRRGTVEPFDRQVDVIRISSLIHVSIAMLIGIYPHTLTFCLVHRNRNLSFYAARTRR